MGRQVFAIYGYKGGTLLDFFIFFWGGGGGGANWGALCIVLSGHLCWYTGLGGLAHFFLMFFVYCMP